MATLIPNTNEELDYAELFDPGEGKAAIADYGKQTQGTLYGPETEKWISRDCPLCFEPFAVHRIRSRMSRYKVVWFCSSCRRKVAF